MTTLARLVIEKAGGHSFTKDHPFKPYTTTSMSTGTFFEFLTRVFTNFGLTVSTKITGGVELSADPKRIETGPGTESSNQKRGK